MLRQLGLPRSASLTSFRISSDIGSHIVEFHFIADNAVVIATLPDGVAFGLADVIDFLCCNGFELGYQGP